MISSMEYHRPTTLGAVLETLHAGPVRVLAGGTDVYPGVGARLAGRIVDITAVAELSGIGPVPGGLRIGGCTTWTEIAEATLPAACAALQQAARKVGGRQVQNVGTIGGNLCNASPAADGVPPLLILDARVELASSVACRVLPLAEFLLGPRRTAIRPDEVLSAIILPDAGLAGRSAFEKLGARSYLVISIAMAAVRLAVTGDQITDAAVSIGACSGTALRLPLVEAALRGPVQRAALRVTDEAVAAALSPIDDVRADAAYRSMAAAELVRRAVGQLT